MYFSCPDKHGVLVDPRAITFAVPPTSSPARRLSVTAVDSAHTDDSVHTSTDSLGAVPAGYLLLGEEVG